jgi:hypothetical protein
MLGHWRTHADYQNFVMSQFSKPDLDKDAIREYGAIISKLLIMDLDAIKGEIAHCYSATGRPAEFQPEIFRTFLLMNSIHVPLGRYRQKLKSSFAIRTACGFLKSEIPPTASFYSFIDRLVRINDSPRVRLAKRKPRKKLGKGEKLLPKHPGIVARLAKKAMGGRRFENRPELTLQHVFASFVRRSFQLGLLGQSLNVSGDGTAIKTGASAYGKKICGCRRKGVYNCECPRKFSDPNATWGWDSHNERYFYGYSGYFISTYNKRLKLDLPLYLRLVDAKRHDSISAIVALAEIRDMHPELAINTFISDSASDNQPTYELLAQWDANAVIALGKAASGNRKYPGPLQYDGNGTPICPAGHKMIPYGYCAKDRNRLKWRCPRACGKTAPDAPCKNCSPSKYGRTVYTKPQWDPRLFTAIPRGSGKWKALMRERTAAERANNRILHHYGIEESKTRGKKRIAFFTTIAGINIHLDAQLAKLKSDGAFDFDGMVLGEKAA